MSEEELEKINKEFFGYTMKDIDEDLGRKIFENKDLQQKKESLEVINNLLSSMLNSAEKKLDKAIKRCEQEISASSYQYKHSHNQQDLVYKVAHERILSILQGKEVK